MAHYIFVNIAVPIFRYIIH